ncbi:MAG TPA: transglutaminaseTgpA domain-containing protein [Solirubrobacteraceae bacterium]|nr:transglutaminaseTgpA domain-containing protein [Solirubrobacteraceae bacterium]
MSSTTAPAQAGARADGDGRADATSTQVQARPWIRLAGFTALALYGVERWSQLLTAPPSLRLLALAGVAIVLVGGLPLLREALAPVPKAATRMILGLIGFVAVLAAFPLAGLSWHLVWYLKIAVAGREIIHGLNGLGAILMPYDGFDHRVTLVIMLGAAVLLLDAAAVLAFAPRQISDARRATAALPLIALAVVPSALVAPASAYLQGLLLFALLVFFVWGERISLQTGGTALSLLAVAGIVGVIAAPLIDHGKPWLNYEKWSAVASTEHLSSFSWNQTYGPLHWPQNGSQVLTVRADTAQYWKAENLDDFNGRQWVLGPPTLLPTSTSGELIPQQVRLTSPSRAAIDKYSERIRVTIQGMRTSEVIGAGQTTVLTRIRGGWHWLPDTGTIEANRALGPGVTYDARVYAPSPSDAELRAASGRSYPWDELRGYLTVEIPNGSGPATAIQFPHFHAPLASAQSMGPGASAFVMRSPYRDAYQLARRLASESTSELSFVHQVMAYLSTGNGFRYDQSPPAARYPLESFLFHSHRGYCQQFSGAMALLLRMGGVPVRVATGFTAGSLDDHTHTWEVADTDAHAWDEVWFPTYGWVKFDPTPVSAPARGGATGPIASGRRTPNLARPGAIPRSVQTHTHTVTHVRHARHHAGSGFGGWALAAIVAAALALGGLIWLAWVVMRPPGSTEQLLGELERALERTGRPLRPGVTLASLEDRYRFTPEVAAYMRALRLSRYGGRPVAPDRAQRRALRRELGLGLGPLGRLRALRALPPRMRGARRSA